MKMTKAKVRAWLLAYAWLDTPAEQAAEVACILAQGDWKYLDAKADRRAGASETGGGPQEFEDAYGMELSSLYECHDEPHLPTCPRKGD